MILIKRLILVVMLGALLGLVMGCSNGYTYGGETPPAAGDREKTTNKPAVTTTSSGLTTKLIDTEQRPPETSTWISPGKVLIGNFYAGAEADYPITIHNGNSQTTDTKKVTTDPGEIEADIPINSLLSKGLLSSIISLSSDNKKDVLVPISYDLASGLLRIKGFSPTDTRILVIQYYMDTKFSIEVRPPGGSTPEYVETIKEVKDWVMVVDPTPVLAPFETRDIEIQVRMPFDSTLAKTLKQLEFWTVVTSESRGQVQMALATRWIITMRG